MKALRYHEYGGTIAIEDRPLPEIGRDQVLVRVEAAALNPLDIKLHSGRMQPFFKLGLPYSMGCDFAGTIERVGADVVSRRPGDRVIGRRPPLVGGAFAEFAAIGSDDCAALPASFTIAQGAGIPTAAGTAWLALFGMAGLQAGQSVLIHAGAGGVGSFAIQFAKAAGAHVVATASGDGIELVRKLGADHVIDYRNQDFTQAVSPMDVVVDTVGFETQAKSFNVVKCGGHMVSVVSSPDEAEAKAKGISVSRAFFKLEPGQLQTIVDEIVKHSFVVLIDREVPFPDFAEAIDRQASGRARGKVVLIEFPAAQS